MDGDDPEYSQHTDDGRYLVIGGRRWRATDPGIPPALRTELVDELMSARRAVAAARRRADATAEATARARVHDAKVALGERGQPWWETSSPEQLTDRIRCTLRALTCHRGERGTICPSDAARVVAGATTPEIMTAVRAVARSLAVLGEIVIEQRGQPLAPHESFGGPIRIRRAPSAPTGPASSPSCG